MGILSTMIIRPMHSNWRAVTKRAAIASLLGACLSLIAAATPSMAAPVVILMSTSSELKPGDVRDSGDTVSLSAGQTVMLNDASGQTRNLTGPYNGPLGGSGGSTADASIVASLSRLVAKRQENQDKVGAVRGNAGSANDPNLISVAQFGAQCLEGDAPLVLWRPKPQPAPMRMMIIDIESDQSAIMTWQPADRSLPWPAATLGQDGGRYWIYWPDHEATQKAIEIQLHMSKAIANPAARASWMEQTGCERQALIVVEKMLQ
ncbi:MAG: hypothetical protein AAGC81_01125 [Pseudomonadota bacterium]